MMKHLIVCSWTALMIASALSAQMKQPEPLTFPLMSKGDMIWVIHYSAPNNRITPFLLLIPG